jgi:hypothetical protein
MNRGDFLAVALCAAVLLLPGCDDLARVPAREEGWTESKFGIHDGALRVGASQIRKDRELEIRCFAHANDRAKRHLDIRYTIYTSPSLGKMEKAFKGTEGLTLNVSVDDGPATLVRVRAGFVGGGPWFLGDIDKALAEKIRDAKSKIVALPAIGRSEPLDATIEFGVKDANKQVTRVLETCADSRPTETSPAGPG